MGKYVLVYTVDGHPECGGGIYFERFDTEEQLSAFANLIIECVINFAGYCSTEYKFEAIEVVTKVEMRRI